jgi:xylulokinase
MPLFLGLDLSTQSLTAVVIDVDAAESCDGDGVATGGAGAIVFETSVVYARDLPHHNAPGTSSPLLVDSDGVGSVHCVPAVWLDAVDAVCARLVAAPHVDVSSIVCVAGAAQQHGTVYCNASLDHRLAALGDVADDDMSTSTRTSIAGTLAALLHNCCQR